MMNAEIIKAWIQASRAKFYIATIMPLALGGVIAYKYGAWDTTRWIVILIASFFVHLNTNLANDFFDYHSGVDEGDSIGGSRVLQEGKITLGQIKYVMIVLYLLSLICGVWLIYDTGLYWLPLVMLFSFFSSVFYTAPPIKYGYRGLGELMVGLNMGPVMVAGTTAVIAGNLVIESLWLSVPIGLMVAFILYYQSLSDINEDKAVGKITVAVRLGRDRFIYGFRAFVVLSIISIVVLTFLDYLHPLAYLGLFTSGLCIKLDSTIRKTNDIHMLHDKGKPVRMFYMVNSLILIIAKLLAE